MDARLAALLLEGPGPSQVPSQRSDLPDDVRLQRELRAAAVARRGGARQELADRQDDRRRVAALREPASPLRLDDLAAGQEAAVHGRRVRAIPRVEPRPIARLAPARP